VEPVETLFKNVLSLHRRWKPFSKMFCLSTVGGNPFQKCFAFPPSVETLFKNVLPFHRRWRPFSKIFCLSTVGGDPFQKYFGVPPETVAIYVFLYYICFRLNISIHCCPVKKTEQIPLQLFALLASNELVFTKNMVVIR
jgi:hypothetical protein